jgi:hypothetical protein
VTRWRRSSTRRPGRDRPNAAGRVRTGRAAARAKSTATAVVDEYEGLILLRASAEAAPRPDDIAELARFLVEDEASPDVFTVVVGAEDAGAELWTRLVSVLDSLRERGVSTIRLALAGAGGDRPGRPAMAQRIADAWGIEVIAPAAGVVIVPGGSLFALGTDPPVPGWRSFRPGMAPRPLGRRSPAPLWQPALARLPGRTARGWVVEQVPAGIFVRRAGAPKARTGNLVYGVPVDGDHLTILVGDTESGDDAGLPAQDLAALLASLPETTRSGVRLAPCGSADLLPVGQDTAELMGTEVEVLTGLPLVVGSSTEPEIRPVLIGADAEPTWVPLVEAVACRPYGADGTERAPRLVRWHSPVSDTGGTDSGVMPLSDRWQVSVTRAGLVVGPRGEAPAIAGRPVSPEQMAVEVNLRGTPADDVLFADLSRVLSGLGPVARKFVTLHQVLPAHRAGEEDFRMLRLAVQHGVSLAEPPPADMPPEPAAPQVRTVASSRARPSGESAAPARSPERATGSMEAGVGLTAEDVTAPATSSPVAERSGYGPAPTTRPTPSSAPAPRPLAQPVPSASAPKAPPLTNAPEPGRPFHDDRAEPLPRILGTIPMTPVTPAGQLAPVVPANPPEPPSPASEPKQEAPAPPSSPARSVPFVQSSLRLPSSAAATAAGSPAAAAEPAPPTSSGPVTPPPSSAAARPDPAAAAGGSRPRVPAKPVRRSTDAERAAFRSLAQPVWERHSAAVNRAMTRLPVLRGAQMDAARTDLVAVHIYLSGDAEELTDGSPESLGCYLACLSSGLCRLPSYRGVAVRGGLPAGGLGRLAQGSVLREPGPVDALPIGIAADLPVRTGGYVIWSSTGRRVRPLLGTTPGVASDEVVFPPGVTFRVLDVRSTGPAPVVLLSEVPGTGPVDDRPGLDDAGRATLERLDEALRKQESSAGGPSLSTWPARCAEPLSAETGAFGGPPASSAT